MADFRVGLYERYATTFKTRESRLDEKTLESYWVWCAHKFLPLLESVGREASLLELGSGPGYFLQFLRNAGFKNASGIDVSEEQTRIAVEKGLKCETADVYDALSNHAGGLDAVVALDFFEHFTKDELARLAPLIHGALKVRGVLILQTPNGEGLFPGSVVYGDLTHSTIFTPDSIRQLLALHGFGDFEFYETGPVPKSFLNRVRLAAWNLIKAAANLVRKIECGKTQKIWTENMICFCRKEDQTSS